MKNISEELPERGKDIVGLDAEGAKHFVFRCSCPNKFCIDWRCSITGMHIFVDIKRWKYDEK